MESAKRSRSLPFCRLVGPLLMVLAGGLLAGVGPALATSPLHWSSPARIDSQPPEPLTDGVSCPSAGLCVAVDASGNVVTSTDPTGGAGEWGAAKVASNLYGGRVLSGVSCVPGPLCVAVDDNGDVITSTDPAGGASRWSVARVDVPYRIMGVSCVQGPLCVAVDDNGDVITSTDPAGGAKAWTVTDVDEHHLIRSVSCASASLCVAVDANGNVITSTEPAGGVWTVAHVDGEAYILGVSCPSTSLCVAVDGVGKVLTSTEPAGGEHAWSATEVEGRAIGAVSCSSRSLCAAVDGAGNILTSTEPTKGKSAWSAAHVDPGKYLWGISCTTGLCVAVNGYGSAFTSTDPAGGVGGWVRTQVDSSYPSLVGVSCASLSLCVAVDNAHNVVSSVNPTGGADAWTTAALSGGAGVLYGVSCPSTTLCVAGGESQVFASTDPADNPSAWTYETGFIYPMGLLLQVGAEYLGPFASMSCVSPSLCIASLDTYNDFHELYVSTDPLSSSGGAWISASHIVGNPNERLDGAPVMGASCASLSLCAAVDAAGNVLASSEPGNSEGLWSIFPVDTNIPRNVPRGISCPSTSLCVAVDSAGNVLTSTNPTGGSSAWAATLIDPGNVLRGVSCVSGSLCVAVDAAGNVLTSTDPVGGSGAWSITPVDAGHVLTSVSCIPAGLCVAVDASGYAVMSTFSLPSQSSGGERSGGGGLGGTTTSTGTAPSQPPSATVSPPATVSGAFRISRVKVEGDGRIVLTLEAPGAGSVSAVATVDTGKTAIGLHKKIKRGATRAPKIAYGAGSASAPGPGAVTVTIRPTRSALSALKSLLMLRVPITVVLHPRGGSPTTVSATVTVRYQHHPASATATATARSGGLTIVLSATPRRAKTGSAIQFNVTASDRHALGALGYRLRYGDGTTAENVVPLFCLAGRGAPMRQTWRLSHRYARAGRYTASVGVYANCTSDHATASVTVVLA